VKLERAGLSIDPVAGRQPVELRGRHAESGVLHAERLEDAFTEERLQRLARGARDQHAQHLGPRVVHPPLARLVHQRQRPQAADPLVGRMWRRRLRGPDAELLLVHGLLDRIVARRHHDHAEPHAERQQVAHGDRPLRRHRVVERPVEPPEDRAPRQLGQQPIHRLVQPELALLHQDHGRRGRDRLGHRGDAKDRVAPDRVAAAERLHADRIDVHLAAPAEQIDDAGHGAALDMAGHDVVHAAEPRRGQSSGAHRCSSVKARATLRQGSHSGRGLPRGQARDL
jgi:hypothetical protein